MRNARPALKPGWVNRAGASSSNAGGISPADVGLVGHVEQPGIQAQALADVQVRQDIDDAVARGRQVAWSGFVYVGFVLAGGQCPDDLGTPAVVRLPRRPTP